MANFRNPKASYRGKGEGEGDTQKVLGSHGMLKTVVYFFSYIFGGRGRGEGGVVAKFREGVYLLSLPMSTNPPKVQPPSVQVPVCHASAALQPLATGHPSAVGGRRTIWWYRNWGHRLHNAPQ